MTTVRSLLLTLAFVCYTTSAALATNGMLLEGYGPVSHAMGGTSMAFDNGAAAMTNNPATLGLMPEGNRIDLAFGYLGPDVAWHAGGTQYSSDSTAFVMPAVGFVRREGAWAYGIGVYAQGGMGTDYKGTPFGDLYSQVSVGKVLVPVAYSMTDRLTVGLTLEYLWANMDLVMGPFDFKDSSDLSGAASGSSVTGKLGFVYRLNDTVNIGGSYLHKGGLGSLTGQGARVTGFDMPAVASIGTAVRVTEKLMLTADYNRIFWSESMRTINVSQNGITMPLRQNWDDQDVLALGLAYDILPQLTVRLGANLGNNPVSGNCTPLFPAIVENHYTTGFGYRFNENHSMDASFAYAPEVRKSNGLDFSGTSTTHSQKSFQLMYSLHF